MSRAFSKLYRITDIFTVLPIYPHPTNSGSPRSSPARLASQFCPSARRPSVYFSHPHPICTPNPCCNTVRTPARGMSVDPPARYACRAAYAHAAYASRVPPCPVRMCVCACTSTVLRMPVLRVRHVYRPCASRASRCHAHATRATGLMRLSVTATLASRVPSPVATP